MGKKERQRVVVHITAHGGGVRAPAPALRKRQCGRGWPHRSQRRTQRARVRGPACLSPIALQLRCVASRLRHRSRLKWEETRKRRINTPSASSWTFTNFFMSARCIVKNNPLLISCLAYPLTPEEKTARAKRVVQVVQ